MLDIENDQISEITAHDPAAEELLDKLISGAPAEANDH